MAGEYGRWCEYTPLYAHVPQMVCMTSSGFSTMRERPKSASCGQPKRGREVSCLSAFVDVAKGGLGIP